MSQNPKTRQTLGKKSVAPQCQQRPVFFPWLHLVFHDAVFIFCCSTNNTQNQPELHASYSTATKVEHDFEATPIDRREACFPEILEALY